MFPLLPIKLIAKSRFASIDKVGELTLPKLFLHARNDRTIPIEHGRKVFAAAAEPKEFVELNAGHADGYKADRATYYGAIDAFIRRVIGPTPVVAAIGALGFGGRARTHRDQHQRQRRRRAPRQRRTRPSAPNRSQTKPNSSDAGSAPIPIARLYQPNAVPRRSRPTRSATIARSRSLGEPEEHAVREEQRPGVPRLRRAPEREVHRGVDRPSREDERLSPEAVG